MGLEWFDWSSAGLLGLFLACFLAATILPFSSEAVLAAAVFGPYGFWTLLAVASAGNWLGGMSTYGLGWWGNAERIAHWLRTDPAKAQRWKGPVSRYGIWLALLCWLPVVGDLIALALGVFRVKPVPVAVLMLLGKAARYAGVILALRMF